MDFKKLLATWDGTKAENKVNRAIIAGLILVDVMLAYAVVTKDTLVVIQPPEMLKEVSISRDQASADYLEAWSWSLALLMGNVHPENLGNVKKGLGQVLDPEIYQAAMADLENQTLAMRRDRISQSFDPRRVIFEKDTKKVFVTGFGMISGPSADPKRETKTFEFEWRVQGHRPLLVYLTSYTGKPRTAEEVERGQKREEQERGKADARRRMEENQ